MLNIKNVSHRLYPNASFFLLMGLMTLHNSNGQAIVKRNRVDDKPDTIIYVHSIDQLDSIAKKMDKRGIGYYYIWSRSYQLQTYGKGYGITIWYIYKGKKEYENDNKLIVKKYTAII